MGECFMQIHKWKLVKDTGANRYYECSKCRKRRVRAASSGGYQPIDTKWLNEM